MASRYFSESEKKDIGRIFSCYWSLEDKLQKRRAELEAKGAPGGSVTVEIPEIRLYEPLAVEYFTCRCQVLFGIANVRMTVEPDSGPATITIHFPSAPPVAAAPPRSAAAAASAAAPTAPNPPKVCSLCWSATRCDRDPPYLCGKPPEHYCVDYMIDMPRERESR